MIVFVCGLEQSTNRLHTLVVLVAIYLSHTDTILIVSVCNPGNIGYWAQLLDLHPCTRRELDAVTPAG